MQDNPTPPIPPPAAGDIPLPPVAFSNVLPLRPFPHLKSRTGPLTAIKPLSQYSIPVLRKAIEAHHADVRHSQAAQLAVQQATTTSLNQLRNLLAEVKDLETRFRTASRPIDQGELAFRLAVAKKATSQERDRVVELKAMERRHDFGIKSSRLDIQAMENEIKSREGSVPGNML